MEYLKNRLIISGYKAILINCILLIVLALYLYFQYSLPLKESLVWMGCVFLYLYIPGNVILRLIKFGKGEHFTYSFLSLSIGFAIIPLLYTCVRIINNPYLIFLLVLIIGPLWIILIKRDNGMRKQELYTTVPDIISVLILLSSVLVLLHYSHFSDIVLLDEGFRIRNANFQEADYHLAVVNSIIYEFPPDFVFVSGTGKFFYHFSMHLQIEMFNRLIAVDTIRLTYYYMPLLYFALIVFIPYALFNIFWEQKVAGVCAGLLMFGSDLSFIPGMIGLGQHDIIMDQYVNLPWTIYFKSTIWSLLTLNGYLPSICVLSTSIILLQKYFKEGKLSYLFTFGLLGVAAFGFKSSMGPHMMGAAFLTGLALILTDWDRRKGGGLCIISFLSFIVMIIYILLLRDGGFNNVIGIDPGSGFRRSLRNLGVNPQHWLSLFIMVIVYIIASYGARLIGFMSFKEVRKDNPRGYLILYLILFCTAGFLLSEFLYLGGPFRLKNNAVWFALQSLMGSWLLVGFVLSLVKEKKKKIFYIFIVLLLSLPTSVQYMTIRSKATYRTVDPQDIEVIEYLRTTPGDSVILFPLNITEPSFAANFAGRTSVYSYYHSFSIPRIGPEEDKKRISDVKSFFVLDNTDLMSRILDRYNVDYVYAPLKYSQYLGDRPMLKRVLKNAKHMVYKVVKD